MLHGGTKADFTNFSFHIFFFLSLQAHTHSASSMGRTDNYFRHNQCSRSSTFTRILRVAFFLFAGIRQLRIAFGFPGHEVVFRDEHLISGSFRGVYEERYKSKIFQKELFSQPFYYSVLGLYESIMLFAVESKREFSWVRHVAL